TVPACWLGLVHIAWREPFGLRSWRPWSRSTVLSQILRRRRLTVSLSSADSGGQQVSIGFKGSHFERDVILWGVRRYVSYPISYRQLEEMMEDRGVEVDHSTLNRR